MKLTDLHKNKGLKINNGIKPHGVAGLQAAPAVDKREQRRLDAARGLVPFACKLPLALTNQLRDTAAQRGQEMNDLVEALLLAGLMEAATSEASAQAQPAPAEAVPAPDKPVAKKDAAKKAAGK
jgi:hypothetical protein